MKIQKFATICNLSRIQQHPYAPEMISLVHNVHFREHQPLKVPRPYVMHEYNEVVYSEPSWAYLRVSCNVECDSRCCMNDVEDREVEAKSGHPREKYYEYGSEQ